MDTWQIGPAAAALSVAVVAAAAGMTLIVAGEAARKRHAWPGTAPTPFSPTT